MIRILQTILKIDSQLGKNASQTAIRTRLIRALMYRCIGVDVYGCAGVKVYECTGMYNCIGEYCYFYVKMLEMMLTYYISHEKNFSTALSVCGRSGVHNIITYTKQIVKITY